MKKVILLTLLVMAGSMIIWSQVPQAMNYKAVAKDDWGIALVNKAISLRFTILQGREPGSIVYQETHATVTTKFGLMNVEIGKGNPVQYSFDLIDWSTGEFYIKIEMDPKGGIDFRLEDPAHQLLSVPYALFAESSGNYSETDPFFTSSASSSIMNNHINNWNDAYGWGNHANAEYLKSFTESDPIFLLHPAHDIASDNISKWSTAYSWGNHAGLYKPFDYFPEWDEITNKPTFASVATTGSYNDLTDKPITDGSETEITAGTNVTITGLGTEASPYVISSTVGGSGSSHYIGESYGGGIIFYLDASGQHGLIAATTDQSTAIQWYNGSATITTAFASSVGGGDGNTSMIVFKQGSGTYAAKLCYDLTSGGYYGWTYQDWYLPSKYELNLMYHSIGRGNSLGLGNVGGFANAYYWSSTEDHDTAAWMQGFDLNGNQSLTSKSEQNYVRAIRSF